MLEMNNIKIASIFLTSVLFYPLLCSSSYRAPKIDNNEVNIEVTQPSLIISK